jgi:acyl-CoA thioesterase FadM
MKRFLFDFAVSVEHLDGLNHFNWLKQFGVMEHYVELVRSEMGIDIKALKQEHSLLLVMSALYETRWCRQLRLGDGVQMSVIVWIGSITSLEFRCTMRKDGIMATHANWIMPLVSAHSGKPVRIPEWMVEIIGKEIPEPFDT